MNGRRRRLDLSYLGNVCTAIANEVADESGFVPVGRLLARFGVELIIRPLLVEGILAKVGGGGGDADTSDRWAVLIDREKYPIAESAVLGESATSPLPSRMRWTIAHELAHSLAFRPTEFGFKLQQSANERQSAGDFVEAIEQETDKLSSLLLWPQRAMETFLCETPGPFTVEKLAKLRRDLGISRYVLVNRLRTFQENDSRGLLQRTTNRNVGIGIGEWGSGGTAVFRSWPLFRNFERNIIPEALLKIGREDRLPAGSLFSDPAFVLCGGNSPTTVLLSSAGIPSAPDAENMVIEVSVETGAARKEGSAFLYLVCGQSNSDRSNVLMLQHRRARDAGESAGSEGGAP